MLAIENLEVVYDDVVLVLRGVSLRLPEGGIVALLGANGAGKTTLLRAISGLLPIHRGSVTKGEVRLDDQRINGLDPSRIVAQGLAQVMEGRRILAELTVEENLRLGAHTNQGGMEEAFERVYGLFPILAARRGSRAGFLSGGEQQMLAMGRALMSGPRYLLLDEPSLGLAPRLVGQVREFIAEINGQGTSVLLVEQNATLALSLADHGYVIETGAIVMDKPAAELAQHEDVREFYLGMHREGVAASYRDLKHYKRRKRWLS